MDSGSSTGIQFLRCVGQIVGPKEEVLDYLSIPPVIPCVKNRTEITNSEDRGNQTATNFKRCELNCGDCPKRVALPNQSRSLRHQLA